MGLGVYSTGTLAIRAAKAAAAFANYTSGALGVDYHGCLTSLDASVLGEFEDSLERRADDIASLAARLQPRLADTKLRSIEVAKAVHHAIEDPYLLQYEATTYHELAAQWLAVCGKHPESVLWQMWEHRTSGGSDEMLAQFVDRLQSCRLPILKLIRLEPEPLRIAFAGKLAEASRNSLPRHSLAKVIAGIRREVAEVLAQRGESTSPVMGVRRRSRWTKQVQAYLTAKEQDPSLRPIDFVKRIWNPHHSKLIRLSDMGRFRAAILDKKRRFERSAKDSWK